MNKSFYNSSMWNSKPIKLAILVPTRDSVYSQFAYCLAQLIKITNEMGIDTYLFFDSSTILLNQRENLIKKAIEVKSDFVLWLDSDMMFPSTSALRLLEHNLDIVACNYMKRAKPLKTVAYTDITNWDSWVPLESNAGLKEVQGVGMGCMLMKTEIFETLTKPYFEFIYKENTQDWFGEDFNLLEKLRNNGFKVYIDTLLSREIKHLGISGFGLEN